MATQLRRKPENVNAKRSEIARRYAWQAKCKRPDAKPDKARLITLIRLRELERIFQHRYGRLLPDDDAGRDDLTLAAHHIVHLKGDVVAHIVAWARAWTPWLAPDQAEQLAARVVLQPLKFTADTLGWRLRLSAIERTSLKITTIGSFDVSKADRLEERKRKKREAERARRAKTSTGRPRGRPRKNPCPAVESDIGVHEIIDRPPIITKEDVVTTPPAGAVGTPQKIDLVKGADAVGVGCPGRRIKTRFPSSMRLSEGMKAYAVSAAFTAVQIAHMFEHYRNWNVAVRSYSWDWEESWANWVDREVRYIDEQQDRADRAYWRARFEGRSA